MLLPVLALAMMQTPAVLEGQRGFDLLQHCLTTIRFIDGPIENRTEGEAAESNLCTGYIDGFLDASVRPICAGDVMKGTVVRLYIAHMKKHPEDNKEYKAVGLNRTLLENYPCAKQPQHAR
jgi:hypothetical protein